MKRRLVAVILAAALLSAALPSTGAQAAGGICFIATNEKFVESSYAYVQGGSVYIPCSAFVYFKIYNSYLASDSVASLYTANKQLYFDIDAGNCYDGSGTYYTAAALWLNGQAYAPVSFVCSQFGLSWSYISSSYGDICRVKDGAVILTDKQFVDAATSWLQPRYEAYMGTYTPGDEYQGADEGCSVYLSFQGMPSDKLLDILKKNGVTATFFVTAYAVTLSPETLRRIVGEGHRVGVLCYDSPYYEFQRAEKLIFEAAHVTTVLVASAGRDYDEICRTMADRSGLVFWDYDIDGVNGDAGIAYASQVTSYLAFAQDRADVRIQCSEATESCLSGVLAYIEAGSYTLRPVCEVGNM